MAKREDVERELKRIRKRLRNISLLKIVNEKLDQVLTRAGPVLGPAGGSSVFASPRSLQEHSPGLKFNVPKFDFDKPNFTRIPLKRSKSCWRLSVNSVDKTRTPTYVIASWIDEDEEWETDAPILAGEHSECRCRKIALLISSINGSAVVSYVACEP
ncbi:MAG: hypothetical protein GY722_07220 [bacterium]|nr:hypothetical protein [bacterium]